MLRNYFKITIRGLARQKGSAFLNIIGLAAGLASVILIFLYVQDELRYDTVHPAPGNTFGIGHEYTNEQGNKTARPYAPSGWAQLMKEQLPEVIEILRYSTLGYPYSMRNPDQDKTLLTQDGEVFLVEQTYPHVLYFDLLQGNPDKVLSNPNSVVLSETAARRLFGSTDVVGRLLEMKHTWITDEYLSLKVTGVIKDYPDNVHMRPDYLIPIEILSASLRKDRNISVREYLSGMDKYALTTYVRLTKGTEVAEVERGLERIIREHLADQANQYDPFFTNITDFHFDQRVDWSWWDGMADIDYIVIFGSIGLIILLIACINYMNLATAKSAKRSKEVGVRKSLGSSRWHLMLQFFQESLLTTLLALLVALLLVVLMLPTFNELADKQFTVASLRQPSVLLGLLVIWFTVAFVAGGYPAIFLSGFKPVEVLKGKLTVGKGPTYFRKTLVVTQFVVSVLLIVSTGIILRQMNMLQSTKLYKQADQTVSVRFGGGTAPIERYQSLKNELLQNPEIDRVTLAIHLPQRGNFAPLGASFALPEISGDQIYDWQQLNGDYDFPKVFDLEVVAGRSFNAQNAADSSNYLVNEAVARLLNKPPDEIIGYTLLDTATQEEGKVIGVVEDFPYESIHNQIKPMVVQGKPHSSNQILYVKLPTDKLSATLATLEATWKEVLPGVGFDYWFLSDEFSRMYYTELKMSNLVRFFSVLAVFIACLGLYGLASYTAEQKTKEIGIRKVLGATVPQVLAIFVTSFLKMILIACALALPLGYWIMQDWLQNFVYRVDISWVTFGIAVAVIVGLALLTVAYESIKAATADPAKSLKYE